MKNQYVLVFVLVIGAFAAGCKPADTPPKSNESAPANFERVQKETKEAVQATKEYAYAQKTEFVEAMRIEIAALKVEMDKLGQQIDNATGPAKEEAKVKLQLLREKAAELDRKFDEVKAANEPAWEQVKAGFQKGYAELKNSIKESRQWLSEKIAP